MEQIPTFHIRYMKITFLFIDILSIKTFKILLLPREPYLLLYQGIQKECVYRL